jgi:aspartyl-tRNA(Asn)/glutamyl-tRNA(Gln) amidotransferase subunit B
MAPARIAALIELIDQGKVSSSIASQRIFPAMLSSEKSPLELAEEMNLIQSSDQSVILGYIDQVIEQNAAEVTRYRNGEKQLIGFLMGQLM